MRVVVVGGGSWGSVFAALLAERGHDVVLACRDPEQAARDRGDRAEPALRPERRPLGGFAPLTIAEAPLAEAELIVARRSQPGLRARSCARFPAGDAPVLSLAKGLDPDSGDRALDRVVETRPVAVLSGPNHAEEIARGPARRRGDRLRGRGARAPPPARV